MTNTTIRINPKYESMRPYIAHLPAIFEQEGDYIYGGRRNLIKAFTMPDGQRIVVKRYAKPVGPNKLVYSWGLRQPKGQRAYEYAFRLLKADIETPESVAYIEKRTLSILGTSYYISLECPYPHRFYELGNAPAGTYEALAEAFARFTATMHDREILHLDYSPGNILWNLDEEGRYHFAIVDINRMRFGPVSMRQGVENLRRLWGPKRFFTLIVAHYARLRGFDEQTTISTALEARRKFWEHYQKKRKIEFDFEP